MKGIAVIVAGAMAIGCQNPTCSSGWGRPVASIKEAKKYKTYLAPVKVEPRTFSWKNHQIDIAECWLDGSYKDTKILFRIKVDGKWLQERNIETKEHKSIEFERLDTKRPVLFFYCVAKGLFGQQRIYFISQPFDLAQGVPVRFIAKDYVTAKNDGKRKEEPVFVDLKLTAVAPPWLKNNPASLAGAARLCNQPE